MRNFLKEVKQWFIGGNIKYNPPKLNKDGSKTFESWKRSLWWRLKNAIKDYF
jgi:hypothetical protein